MKTIIHVNQHIIKANKRAKQEGKFDYVPKPPLTVKTYKETKNAHEVEILGSSKVVHSPNKPLSCGAHVWIETESEVVIL